MAGGVEFEEKVEIEQKPVSPTRISDERLRKFFLTTGVIGTAETAYIIKEIQRGAVPNEWMSLEGAIISGIATGAAAVLSFVYASR